MTVWSRVVTSASYAFVYSHSLAYTMIGYWCMWLKVHHPVAFYTAQLRKIDKEKWPKLIRDAQDHGIKVTGVDLKRSGETWTPYVKGNRIMAGFLQMPQCGPAMAERIIAHREGNGFEAGRADQLLAVKGIGAKTLDKMRPLIEGTDPFGLLKTQIALDAVRTAIADRSIPVRRPTTNSDGILDLAGGKEVVWVGMVKQKEYKDAIEDERARSGDSLEDIRARLKRPDLAANCVLHAYDDAGEDVYVRINRFAFPKFKEQLEHLKENDDVIWVLARKSNGGFGASIYVDKMVTIDPSDDDDENEPDD
jgi:DNA polymerase-3 subunit alpha